MRRSALARPLLAVLPLVALACGPSASELEADELPPRLAAAIPRLEESGYEVEAFAAGPEALPAVAVMSDPPIVLAAVPPGENPIRASIGLTVRTPSGEQLDASISVICAREIVAGPRGSGTVRRDVANVAGLC